MIGLGTWGCSVNTMFFKGDAQIRVFDNGGKYGIELEVPGVDIPDITIIKTEEDGNTLLATVQTSLLPGKDIEMNATFEGDTVNGFIKVPFLGKVKIQNGHKIA